MTEINYPQGITSQMVQTDRLNMHVLTSGPEDGIPVIFLHGNFSAAFYWVDTMLALPPQFRAIAPDLRNYGWTEVKPVDATRGMRDWSDDLYALMETLNIRQAHLVGWSLSGGILYRFLIDYPGMARSITLEAPVSPFGFGGTRDPEGFACYPDFAGSGGGTVNPEFVARIKSGDRSADDPNSPRNVISAFYFAPPFQPERMEDYLTAALRDTVGDQFYPGDFVPSENWPNVAPGVWGPINAGSPKYVRDDVPELLAMQPDVPVLWIHGDKDLIVSDNSLFDFGTLGQMGLIPGWPGLDIYPPQPMVSQTRALLNDYAAGQEGLVEEHIFENCGHGPHIEKAEDFNRIFHAFLSRAEQRSA